MLYVIPDVSLVGKIEFNTDDLSDSEWRALNVRPGQVGGDIVEMVWLKDVIYVLCHRITRLRKYHDSEPFDQYPEEIEVGVYDPVSMIACARKRSIYISDFYSKCIVKVQMPDAIVDRWDWKFDHAGLLSPDHNEDLILCVNCS